MRKTLKIGLKFDHAARDVNVALVDVQQDRKSALERAELVDPGDRLVLGVEDKDPGTRPGFVFDDLRRELFERLMLRIEVQHALLDASLLRVERLIVGAGVQHEGHHGRRRRNHRDEHDREYHVPAREP